MFERHAPIAVIHLATKLGEEVGEELWDEAALRVVGSGVAAVLRSIDIVEVDAEERVRDDLSGRERHVGEADVDEDRGKESHDDVPIDQTEADESLVGRDDAVAIEIEEVTMLLKNLEKRRR